MVQPFLTRLWRPIWFLLSSVLRSLTHISSARDIAEWVTSAKAAALPIALIALGFVSPASADLLGALWARVLRVALWGFAGWVLLERMSAMHYRALDFLGKKLTVSLSNPVQDNHMTGYIEYLFRIDVANEGADPIHNVVVKVQQISPNETALIKNFALRQTNDSSAPGLDKVAELRLGQPVTFDLLRDNWPTPGSPFTQSVQIWHKDRIKNAVYVELSTTEESRISISVSADAMKTKTFDFVARRTSKDGRIWLIGPLN